MNPNTPGHPENDEPRAIDMPPEQHDQPDKPKNPYTAKHAGVDQEALDQGAARFHDDDVRQLNRKALGLLAGIVLLLAVAAFWLARSSNGDSRPAPKDREESISVTNGTVGAGTMTAPPALPKDSFAIPLRKANTLPAENRTPDGNRSQSQPRPQAANAHEQTGPVMHQPTLLERRIAAANMGGGYSAGADVSATASEATSMPSLGSPMPGMPGAAGSSAIMGMPPNLAYSAKALAEVSSAAPLQHPDTLMLRGTFIRCVLETRIVTDNPGFTSCVVTEPVYSFTGKRMLLPKGSKVMGRYDMEPNGPRLAVIWDRIVTPTGIDVNMASPGVDTLGGSGHPGHYNAHWGSRITAALLISLMSDAFKYAGAKYGPKQTSITNGVVTQSPFESNTAETVQELANQAVRRQANRPATITINQGTVLAIYVAKDVDFSGVVARY